MEALKLELVIDPSLPPCVEGAISFETGGDPGRYVYGQGRPGPLLCFFEDLISGMPMPLTFATRRVAGPHTVMAAALFLDREIAVHPDAPALVYAIDLVHRMGDPMHAHLAPPLAQFIRGLAGFFPSGISKTEQGTRLATSIQWIRDYLASGNFPSIGTWVPYVRVLDVGTNGFVVATSPRVCREAWENLFRWGHLRGLLVGEGEVGLRPVLAARKSLAVGFDLERLVPILNELEQLSGGEMGWALEGNYLVSPRDGTTILLQHLIDVFLRG